MWEVFIWEAVNLKQINLRDFTVDKVVQTENDKSNATFVKYPCKYFGTNIENPYHLYEHIERCRGTYNFCTEPGLPVIKFFPPSFNLHPPLHTIHTSRRNLFSSMNLLISIKAEILKQQEWWIYFKLSITKF